MTIEEFIGSIDNKTYNKIRSSQSDAECRRYLKEHLRKQLNIPAVSVCSCGSNDYFAEVHKDVTKYYCNKCYEKIDSKNRH